MTVRAATASDLPVVRALQSLLPEPVDELFADGLPPGLTFVAVPASASIAPDSTAPPVGYVHAYETGYVSEVVVAPRHRGDGHGRALLARALAELRARGVEAVELELAAENDAARSLYDALGFEVVERRPDRYESGDGLRMVLDLTE